MARRKACMIRLDRKLMQKLRKLSKKTNISVGTLVCFAVRQYLMHEKYRAQRHRLKQGYIAMGAINRAMANEAVFSDEQQFFTYEQYLSESE